jgi:hypothetical protein
MPPPRTTLDEKRILLLEGLSGDIQRLEETVRENKSDFKELRVTLTSIQITLQGMQSQELSLRFDKLAEKCFGDHSNSLDSRVRALQTWQAKVVGMAAVLAALVSVLVSWISKHL